MEQPLAGPSKTSSTHHDSADLVSSHGSAAFAVILRQEKFDEMSKARIALILFRLVDLQFDVV